MKALVTSLLLALSALLAGCATTEPPKERIVYRFVKVPVEMTEKVVMKAPPEPAAYAALSCGKQEEVLISLIQDHMKTIGVANARLEGVEVWSVKQSLIYTP